MNIFIMLAMIAVAVVVAAVLVSRMLSVLSPRDTVIVELKIETYKFLKELNRRIETQNNRGTAKPYFLVIRSERWRVAHDEFHNGETRKAWVDFDGDPTTFHSKEEAIKWFCDYHRDLKDPGPNADPDDITLFNEAEGKLKEQALKWFDNLDEYTEQLYYDEDNVFLTDEGYEEHMRLNGHNVKRGGPHHTYMKHAFRNPEMDGIFKAIKEIGEY